MYECMKEGIDPEDTGCCDLAESVGSQEHWLWDVTRKRNEVLLFSIVLRIIQLLIRTLEPLVRFRWGFQQNVPRASNEHFNLQSNRKLIMSHVRLQTGFPLDCITNVSSGSMGKGTATRLFKLVPLGPTFDIKREMLWSISYKWLMSSDVIWGHTKGSQVHTNTLALAIT